MKVIDWAKYGNFCKSRSHPLFAFINEANHVSKMTNAIFDLTEKQAKQFAVLKQRSTQELLSLSPDFSKKVLSVLRQMEAKGWFPVVFHGKRTAAEQAKKVAAGYSKTMKSFHVTGTGIPSGRNNLYWQTRGEAADIVDARYLWTGPAANLNFEFWRDLGEISKAYGLRWGGDWKKFRDVAHVEMTHIEFSQDTRGVMV